MNKTEGIVNISVERLFPHPENPRKELGDLTEMTESIKKQGIMQNLTVIPVSALTQKPEKQTPARSVSLTSDFHVLIGHRRLAAAKQAGLTEVPCRIVSEISKKEQLTIMLEENMQRNDLTIFEQAQGFQMMIDLGETPETISKRTGFSKSTVHHRLNIAKLDMKELKKKEDDEEFQLSLKDLYALEQISDIETRNRILKEASNSRELIWKAQNAAADAERQKKKDAIIKMLEGKGIEKAPKSYSEQQYTNKWETVKEYDVRDKQTPKKIILPKGTETRYYYEVWFGVKVVQKACKKKETRKRRRRS